MEIQLLRRTNGDGRISFKEMSKKSKKYDDYEFLSTQRTINLCYALWLDRRFLDTKEDREIACRYLWCGIKVAFYLDPSSDTLEAIFRYLRKILTIGNREFNKQFKDMRDYEILNYKDPFEDQANVIATLNDLLNQI
jgi:hypothetical protein